MRPINDFELQLDAGQTISQFRLLTSKRVLIDLIVDSQIQEPILLRDQQCLLPRELGALRSRIPLFIVRLGTQHFSKPVADRIVLNANAIKNLGHLTIEFALRHTGSRVSRPGIVRTSVIPIPAFTLLVDLPHVLAGDSAAAMSTSHELAAVSKFMGAMNTAPEERLYAVPGCPLDKRLVPPGIPLAAKFHFPDVGAILKDIVNTTARKLESPGSERQPLVSESRKQTVEGDRFIGIKLKDSTYVRGRNRVDLNDAAPVFAYVAVAVWRASDEPTLVNATREPFANIDALLLGIEAGHVRKRPPHHAAGRIVVCWLRDRNERQLVRGFETLKLDIVK